RQQDRLVGCGGAVAQALIDNEGLPAGRVEVIYNGVDLAALSSPAAGAGESIRREFSLSSEDFVVLQVARLHELKDHQTALRAIDRARTSCPQIRLVIVGDGEKRTEIERTIRERRLEQHVRLAGTRSDIASLLAAADVCLLSSISEGIPLTIIEAMAARLPVVATAVGGIPEMIEHGVTGYLARAGDEDSLANHLLQLHRNPLLREKMGQTSERKAQQQFSLDGMIQQYREVYREMLGEQPRRLRLPAVGTTSGSGTSNCSHAERATAADLSGACQ
ncbi:MAG: glycosyltransferase family 4 protein, partial [Planctomycetaceae bacterium]|nr:glycosyltransferase family 4 protein [Planctomycetaceae bacterium]